MLNSVYLDQTLLNAAPCLGLHRLSEYLFIFEGKYGMGVCRKIVGLNLSWSDLALHCLLRYNCSNT